MKRVLAFLAFVGAATSLMAAPRLYLVPSPTHEQTFTFGSERRQQWIVRGADRHLALAAEFTNDPYVDQINIRQYDDFIFDFPDVRLGADGRTLSFRTLDGGRVAVAECYRGFLGLEEVTLLPGNAPLIQSPHGYLSLSLLVREAGAMATTSL